MAHNTAAWIREHAEYYYEQQERIEAERAQAARARDIADLRGGYTVFVQQFATAAERAAIDAGFEAIAAADPINGYSAYADAVNAVDQMIDAIDARADAERAAMLRLPGGVDNALALAFDGWVNSQAIAAQVAA